MGILIVLRFTWLVVAILWCLPVHAQIGVGGSGTSSKCTTEGLPLDSNGWTVYPTTHTMGSSAVGKTYYVSTTEGNDGTAVANNVAKPWLTVAAAITQMKSDAGGNNSTTDSWLLLKRGDIFLNQSIGGSFASISGIDCLHPMVISSYDPSQPDIPDPYGNFTVSGITCSAGTATITTASAHGLNNGQAYQIVLTKELPAEFNGKFSGTVTGASTLTFPITCPAASDTLPGIMTLRRPVLEVAAAGAAVCGPKDAGNASDFLIFSGIECYGYTYDPDNAAWNKSGYTTTLGVFTTAGRVTYQLVENIAASFNFYNSVDAQPNASDTTGLNFTMRRNVNYYSAGSYFQGWLNLNLIENYSFYDGWNPNLAGGQSVTVTTGTPGTITWGGSLNPLVDGTGCSAIKFTGGTLPTGIVSGTQYYVTNLIGSTFNIATACNGTPINLSGSPSGVIGYWFGTPSLGFPGIFPQGGSCAGGCVHTYYIQNGAASKHGVIDINTKGNVIGFTAGSSLQGGGNSDQNLMFQSWSPLTAGKRGESAERLAYTNTNNGVFKVAQPWNAVPYTSPSGPLTTTGLTLGGRAGTNLGTNNLIAYESSQSSGLGHGIDTTDINYYPMVSTLSRNVACGLTTPIKPNQGLLIGFDTIVGGSGYSEYTSTSPYYSPFGLPGQGGIPATGGSGYGLGLVITVNGATGQVSAVDIQYQMNGFGYKVGDIISSDNTYIGGAGSGWSARIASVSSVGGASTFDTIVGGSNYIAGTVANLTGGSGTSGQAVVAMGPHGCGSSCSLQAIYAYTGYGYQVGDTVTVSSAHTGSAATARVATVINNNLSNNTFKAADCNNLQNATGSGGTGQPNSVAPPLTPSASPPTDVIGEYFASLPYGYQYTVPAMLVGTSSAYEQGYMHQASLQQKANWDTALMAKSILDWARPQFGMVNP